MNDKDLRTLFASYVPWNEQERKDQMLILQAFDHFDDLLTRANTIIHLCASPWILSRDHKQVLLIYHRIYDSWGWSGGHCDGDPDLSAVALREGKEETGISSLQLASEELFAIDVLSVPRHEKKGEQISSHLHINVTYLVYGDPSLPLVYKADEVKGARWFDAAHLDSIVQEKAMLPVYDKLNEKARMFK